MKAKVTLTKAFKFLEGFDFMRSVWIVFGLIVCLAQAAQGQQYKAQAEAAKASADTKKQEAWTAKVNALQTGTHEAMRGSEAVTQWVAAIGRMNAAGVPLSTQLTLLEPGEQNLSDGNTLSSLAATTRNQGDSAFSAGEAQLTSYSYLHWAQQFFHAMGCANAAVQEFQNAKQKYSTADLQAGSALLQYDQAITRFENLYPAPN